MKKTNTGNNNAGTLDKTTGYLVKKVNGVKKSVHRLVTNAKKGDIVDHINGNKTDNRLDNLRFVTKSQNNRNRTSKGYTLTKSGKYEVKTTYKNKTYYIGSYDDLESSKIDFQAVSKFVFEITGIDVEKELRIKHESLSGKTVKVTLDGEEYEAVIK